MSRSARKYEINPHFDSGNDTLCMNLRRIWLEADAMGSERIKELAADAFDGAKRMDARLKDYKAGRA